ncbi:MAG: ribonuclease III [Spirochaetota bacterium]
MRKNKKSLNKQRKEKLINYQKKLGIRFKDMKLLNMSLLHKSFVNEVEPDLENNEKLEFLGDAFIGLVVSDLLYNQNLYFNEGTLARIKSYVVSEPTLYRIGTEINIQDYILIGRGEEKSGGRHRRALIGDCVEALVGAYYLDAGFKQARKFTRKLFEKEIVRVEQNKHQKDYKSILQEYAQKKFKIVPSYRVVNTEGPDHNKTYFVNVTVKKKTYGPGVGESKKQAEQNAAGIALNEMNIMKKLKDPSIEFTGNNTSQNNDREDKVARQRNRAKHSSKNAGA